MQYPFTLYNRLQYLPMDLVLGWQPRARWRPGRFLRFVCRLTGSSVFETATEKGNKIFIDLL